MPDTPDTLHRVPITLGLLYKWGGAIAFILSGVIASATWVNNTRGEILTEIATTRTQTATEIASIRAEISAIQIDRTDKLTHFTMINDLEDKRLDRLESRADSVDHGLFEINRKLDVLVERVENYLPRSKGPNQ